MLLSKGVNLTVALSTLYRVSSGVLYCLCSGGRSGLGRAGIRTAETLPHTETVVG